MKINDVITEVSLGDYPEKARAGQSKAMRSAMSGGTPEERNKQWAVHDKRKRGLARAEPRIRQANIAAAEQALRDKYAGVDIDAEIARLQPAIQDAYNDYQYGASNTYKQGQNRYESLAGQIKELQRAKQLLSQGVAEGLAQTPKITFAQQTPGSWTHIDILVNGEVKFQAVKTMGPGFWNIYDLNGEPLRNPQTRAGYGGGNKTALKSSVLDYLSKQGVAEMDSQSYTGSRDPVSKSTYGSRDKGLPSKGPDKTGKAVTAKDVVKTGTKALNKAFNKK